MIVTSGAIAAGTTLFKSSSTSANHCVKASSCSRAESADSSLGKIIFAIYDIHIGQILLTRADIEDRERFLNASRYITCPVGQSDYSCD